MRKPNQVHQKANSGIHRYPVRKVPTSPTGTAWSNITRNARPETNAAMPNGTTSGNHTQRTPRPNQAAASASAINTRPAATNSNVRAYTPSSTALAMRQNSNGPGASTTAYTVHMSALGCGRTAFRSTKTATTPHASTASGTPTRAPAVATVHAEATSNTTRSSAAGDELGAFPAAPGVPAADQRATHAPRRELEPHTVTGETGVGVHRPGVTARPERERPG